MLSCTGTFADAAFARWNTGLPISAMAGIWLASGADPIGSSPLQSASSTSRSDRLAPVCNGGAGCNASARSAFQSAPPHLISGRPGQSETALTFPSIGPTMEKAICSGFYEMPCQGQDSVLPVIPRSRRAGALLCQLSSTAQGCATALARKGA